MLIMLAETMRCLSCVGPVLGMYHSIYVCTADLLVILPSCLHKRASLSLPRLCAYCICFKSKSEALQYMLSAGLLPLSPVGMP